MRDARAPAGEDGVFGEQNGIISTVPGACVVQVPMAVVPVVIRRRCRVGETVRAALCCCVQSHRRQLRQGINESAD